MRARIVELICVFLLVACGTPTPDLTNLPPDLDDDASRIEPIASVGLSTFEPPPPLDNGTFSQLMPSSINEVLFEEDVAGDFFIIGAIEMDGLIYIYLHNEGEIFYAVSNNGSEWALSPEAIFEGLNNYDFEFHPASIQALPQGFAIYLGSATANYAEFNYSYSIWSITAPEPTGPWTLSEAPILYGWPNPLGYALYIAHPIVRPYLDGFRMYYAFSFQIEGIHNPEFALAHSWDGLSWRYTPDLPTTKMADSIIALSLESENELESLPILDVWPTQAGWQMLYFQEGSDEGSAQIHLADSEDGQQWVPSDIEFRLPDESPVEYFVSASMLYYQGQYLLTYCTMPQNHTFQCYVAANNSGPE